MRILLAGGSGQIGAVLGRHFLARGDEVATLTRSATAPPGVRPVVWDGRNPGHWEREVEGCNVLINLAGRSVNCRYHAANRREIMDSRTESTHAIGRAIAAARHPPPVWLQASTATIYSHRFDAANDDVSGIIGGSEPGAPDTWRFSIDVARAWEDAANQHASPKTRLVLLRSAMTMSIGRGGIFDTLLTLVRRGLGGTCGDGRQFVSWVHESDFVRAIDWLVARREFSGPVNITSPNPIPNAEFMRTLRRAWGAPIGLPAPAWLLEVGAIFMRTETELILKSRRVTPRRLLESGFEFSYPDWADAAAELCARCRNRR